MSEELSFAINDDSVDALRYLIENIEDKDTNNYVQAVYPNGKKENFKINKVYYNPKFYFKKIKKKYKRFIKPTNEYFFEGMREIKKFSL